MRNEKFVELVNHAKRNGEAVGIGHATRKDTISVLKELIPEYENSQVQFVYISELVK